MSTEQQKDQSRAIAIIGMGCMFPQAEDLKSYWSLLRHGKDAISEIPETHWSPEEYFDADPKKPDHTYAKRGGFLSPLNFDPSEFGIPPNILEATDTAQLLGLVAAKRAMEDAGYGADREFDREKVSVIMGVTGTLELVVSLGARLSHPLWRKAINAAGITGEKADEIVARISDGFVPWQESSFPGLLGNVVAGRIANRLDFGGTNCVVDAACASSLSAIHLACMELEAGRADMVLSGGVDTLNDIFMYMCFSKTPALSASGDARPFAKDADGTILCEGVGTVLLKRLEDAERDGDKIYAVLKGVGTSSDGRAQSIYAPRATGQMKALRRAYTQAGVSPKDIQLVEAHGTGTRVGDAVEFDSLRDVYGVDLEEQGTQWCALGSVKSQIGHSKAAAGAASLIKTTLALHHKTIPPTIKIDEPNPKLSIEESPFYLSTETRPWLKGDAPRRAAVSSFGFGGSNFHLVLEEYNKDKVETAWDGEVELIALSANKVETLRDSLEEALTQLENKEPGVFARWAHAQRAAFSHEEPYRLSCVWEREKSVKASLQQALRHLDTQPDAVLELPDLFYAGTATTAETRGKVAALFPGQGSQYPGMGRDLCLTFPEVQSTIETANLTVDESLALGDTLYPTGSFAAGARKQQSKALANTAVAQPAIGAVSLGMWRLMERFGLEVEVTAGHSYGELVALCVAGRMSPEALFQVSEKRGALMAEGDKDRGTMLAVRAPLADIDALIDAEGLDVVLANRNSPTQGVLSGSHEAIDKAEQACQSQGFDARRLPVSAAFHSELVADAKQPFRDFLAHIDFQDGTLVSYANTTAETHPEDADALRDLLAKQLLYPVRFVEEVEAMYAAGVRTFLEIGPKTVMTSLVKAILGDRPHQAVALDRSRGKRNGIGDLARMLGQLAVLGLPLDLKAWEDKPAEARKQWMKIPISGANYRSTPHEFDNEADAKRALEAPPAPAPRPVAATPSTAMSSMAQAPQVQPPTQPSVAVSSMAVTVAPSPAVTATGLVSAQASPPSFQHTSSPLRGIAMPARKPTSTPSQRSDMSMANPPMYPAPTNLSQQGVVPSQASLPTQADAGVLTAAFQMVHEGLRSMQTLQQQTSLAHQRFLEGQEFAQQAMQHMLLSSQRLVETAMGVPTSAPVAAIAPRAQQAAPVLQAAAPLMQQAPVMQQVPVAPAPYVAATPTYTPAPVAPAAPAVNGTTKGVHAQHYVAPAPVAAAPVALAPVAPAPVAPPVSTPAPAPVAPVAPAPVAAASTASLPDVILEVVADLTGYPVEMLSLEMDMEADLGIDSIKRVEILSTISERLPEVASVNSDSMGSLRTLAQVIEYMDEQQGTSAPVAAPVAVAETSESGDAGFQDVLLGVVADLTGYPAEMLNLEMDMEADLGIDSIKRVEILSTVTEKVPALSQVDTDQMRNLRTLQQIVDALPGGDTSGPSNPLR